MPRKIIAILTLLLLTSCLVKKKTTYSKTRTVTVTADDKEPRESKPKRKNKKTNETADNIVNSALGYSGTRYKYGGTTKKGMDCSGLIHVAFLENGVGFPRVSYRMANEGQKIGLGKVEKGDLLFFKTSKTSRRINHVGLVVEVDGTNVFFIHATSSRGVIVSSLREGYWKSAFVKATRVL